MIIKALNDLPPRAHALLWVVTLVTLAALVYREWLVPQRVEITEYRARLAALQLDAGRAQAVVDRWPATARDLATLEQRWRDRTGEAPIDPQDVLRELSTVAGERGMEIEGFTPKPVVAHAGYIERPVALKLAGNYHQLGQFLEGLASASSFIALDDLDITPNASSGITAACIATTLSFGPGTARSTSESSSRKISQEKREP